MVNTLSVNLAESGGALTGTSQASAQQGSTVSLVDGELLAYESATLVSGNSYNLTGLARGLYGTTAAAHALGAAFTRLDSAIATYSLPTNFVGATLYFKFQSFNVFGAGVQSLSSCSVYTYVPTGEGLSDPIAQQLLSGFPLDLGLTSVTASVSDDFGSTVGGVLSIIDLGTAP